MEKDMISSVFLGCNYNDKSIKRAFDNIKIRIEKDYPITCVLIDKRKGKTAKDIWKDIKHYIDNSSLCIFDVSSFRPNVVLELGYAMAIKDEEEEVMISFRKRKDKGKKPEWLLSDIGHLRRFEYSLVVDLEKEIRSEIENMQFIKKYKELELVCQKSGDMKYYENITTILFSLRNDGVKTKKQVQDIIKGSNLRISKVYDLLKRYKLVYIDTYNRIRML
jgi:hypothetical protein